MKTDLSMWEWVESKSEGFRGYGAARSDVLGFI